MSLLFNIKKNQILNTFAEFDGNEFYIEDNDSYHMFLPIKIKSYYNNVMPLLMKFLHKNQFSINVNIFTKDGYLISVNKSSSYTYRHIINNTILISSYDDLKNKIKIINKSISNDEIPKINNMINDSNINLANPKISFIELLSLLGVKISKDYSIFKTVPSLPGGHISKYDNCINDTLFREIEEELSIPKDIMGKSIFLDKITYHNIFDKYNEFFYHNLEYYIHLDLTSYMVNKIFKASREIKSINFISIDSHYLPLKLIELYNETNICKESKSYYR